MFVYNMYILQITMNHKIMVMLTFSKWLYNWQINKIKKPLYIVQ